jgi:RimJ/RimL family protein N-acetyltransferase
MPEKYGLQKHDHWPPYRTLTGTHVELALLSHDHAVDLAVATSDGALLELWYTSVPHPDDISDEIYRRLELRQLGMIFPYAVLETKTGKAVGMTTFMNIDAAARGVEIGSTWYRKSAQRSAINTECKMLLLAYTFEELDCIAVEFRTHILYQQSRAAIERLGAHADGISRSHTIMANGTIRDTAVYSIIRSEWPTIKTHLSNKLGD